MFPVGPGPALTEDEVCGVLAEVHRQGWPVIKEPPDSLGHTAYSIVFANHAKITIEEFERGVRWRIKEGPLGRASFEVTSVGEFRARLFDHARKRGVDLAIAPPVIRFDDSRRATNLGRFVELLRGRGAITDIFDPYLKNETLQNFASMAAMGVSFAPTVRMLTSEEMALRKKQLTSKYVQDFLAELNATGAARCFPHAPGDKKHRRFLLLSSHEVVVVGMSMNFFGHDETASVEPQFYARDLAFFDQVWSAAMQVP